MFVVLAGAPLRADAQAADPTAPRPVSGWVIDLRGATTGLPTDGAFFPGGLAETPVPARGFGFDVGGHVYLLTLGPSRIGIGANYLRVRGTTETVVSNLGALAPQVSFNFGTIDGWSYLSAGWGRAWVRTAAEQAAGAVEHESGGLTAINVGGGARWFVASRAAIGFDVRFLRVSATGATPGSLLASASVGLSVR